MKRSSTTSSRGDPVPAGRSQDPVSPRDDDDDFGNEECSLRAFPPGPHLLFRRQSASPARKGIDSRRIVGTSISPPPSRRI